MSEESVKKEKCVPETEKDSSEHKENTGECYSPHVSERNIQDLAFQMLLKSQI